MKIPSMASAGGRQPAMRAFACRLLLWSVLVSLFGWHEAAAQETDTDGALRVFLDCADCDFDYLRREIPFADYVRDREDADVHVLVTARVTGPGGTEFSLSFIGQNRFAESQELVRYASGSTDTGQETREGLTRTLKLALLRYVAETDQADRVVVMYSGPDRGPLGGEQPPDPWDFWVFRFGLDGFASAERSTSSLEVSGDASANRTTEDWKFNLVLDMSHSESNFDLSDLVTVKSTIRSYGGRALLVKSLGPHLSAGTSTSFSSSTFFNQNVAFRFAPAVEYNLFPYAESSERQLTFRYSLGANAFSYEEETIFDKTGEVLADQELTIVLSMIQPWGTASVSVEGRNFLDDFSKNRVDIESSVDFRIFRGLAVTVFGGASRVADQINLPKGGVTDEEILLRQRELATTFQYFIAVGLSYTFGSIFSNVVNPRFSG